MFSKYALINRHFLYVSNHSTTLQHTSDRNKTVDTHSSSLKKKTNCGLSSWACGLY